MDWQNSANEIQNLIGQCKNEVKRLQRIYRGISGYQSKQMSAQSLQKGKATRAANAIARQNNPNAFLKPQYGTVGQGSADVTGQAEKLGSLRKTTRPQAQGWIGSTNGSLEEGIFSRADEVDKICKNWRSYVGNKDAAAKVQERISKYQTMIQQLQAIIDKGVSRGHITDVNADARSAAKAAGSGSAQQQYKQVAEAVDNAIKNVLNESRFGYNLKDRVAGAARGFRQGANSMQANQRSIGDATQRGVQELQQAYAHLNNAMQGNEQINIRYVMNAISVALQALNWAKTANA